MRDPLTDDGGGEEQTNPTGDYEVYVTPEDAKDVSPEVTIVHDKQGDYSFLDKEISIEKIHDIFRTDDLELQRIIQVIDNMHYRKGYITPNLIINALAGYNLKELQKGFIEVDEEISIKADSSLKPEYKDNFIGKRPIAVIGTEERFDNGETISVIGLLEMKGIPLEKERDANYIMMVNEAGEFDRHGVYKTTHVTVEKGSSDQREVEENIFAWGYITGVWLLRKEQIFTNFENLNHRIEEIEEQFLELKTVAQSDSKVGRITTLTDGISRMLERVNSSFQDYVDSYRLNAGSELRRLISLCGHEFSEHLIKDVSKELSIIELESLDQDQEREYEGSLSSREAEIQNRLKNIEEGIRALKKYESAFYRVNRGESISIEDIILTVSNRKFDSNTGQPKTSSNITLSERARAIDISSLTELLLVRTLAMNAVEESAPDLYVDAEETEDYIRFTISDSLVTRNWDEIAISILSEGNKVREMTIPEAISLKYNAGRNDPDGVIVDERSGIAIASGILGQLSSRGGNISVEDSIETIEVREGEFIPMKGITITIPKSVRPSQ